MIEADDKTYDSVEELFEDLDYTFKKENPIGYWIDNKLFKNKNGLCGYAVHYTLSHPWVIFKYYHTHIVWAWQRVFRKWDDRVIWSIDYHLAEMMPIWLEELKRKSMGAPTCYLPQDKLMEDMTNDDTDMAQKKWFEDIDIIIDGFVASKKLQDNDFDIGLSKKDYRELEKAFSNGMKKLTEIWNTLWW